MVLPVPVPQPVRRSRRPGLAWRLALAAVDLALCELQPFQGCVFLGVSEVLALPEV